MNDGRDDVPVVKVTDKRRFAGTDTGEATPSRPCPTRTPTTRPRSAAVTEDKQGQVDEYRAHLQRLQAEFDNYRKRVLREQTTAVEMAAEPVMRRLLEVLDDFELALLHANDDVDRDRLPEGRGARLREAR